MKGWMLKAAEGIFVALMVLAWNGWAYAGEAPVPEYMAPVRYMMETVGLPAGEWQMPGTEKWEDIDRFLQEEGTGDGQKLSFTELVKKLIAGEGREAGSIILAMVQNTLWAEIRQGGQMAGQLLAIGLVGAIFANFASIFNGSQIAETGFFMTYLLAFTVLAAAFFGSVSVASQVLEKQVEFMKVLLPSYFLVVAWAGGSISSAAWMELVMFLIGAVQWLYLSFLLPAVRIYILLVLAGNMAKEDMLSKMTELLRSGVQWGTRSLIGLVLGFQVIQGMVLPYADAAKTAGAQKLLSAIPGIGQGAGTVTKLILGSGVLIKNSMGAAAVVILAVISLVPVLKLVILLLIYRMTAAVLQPVGDKRLIACISSVADGQKLLLGLTVSGLLLFVVTIALICMGTNVSFLA